MSKAGSVVASVTQQSR